DLKMSKMQTEFKHKLQRLRQLSKQTNALSTKLIGEEFADEHGWDNSYEQLKNEFDKVNEKFKNYLKILKTEHKQEFSDFINQLLTAVKKDMNKMQAADRESFGYAVSGVSKKKADVADYWAYYILLDYAAKKQMI
ncbi:MAG: hypothetical protein L3J74_15560, partial [Bacteroidales bacterium]|nr:hypothetical protein [Bacteroidales bacterium]